MNRIYKIIRNRGSNQTVVVSELAKGNKKSLSGNLLALSIAGILASTSISIAQADQSIVTNSSDTGSNSLQGVLNNLTSSNQTVTFDSETNPTGITRIEINKTDITIQGNNGDTLGTVTTINSILNSVNTAREQASDNTAFAEWLNNDLENQIEAKVSDLVNNQKLTQITVAGQVIDNSGESALFYSKDGAGNGLNIENMHITMNDSDEISFSDSAYGGGLIGVNTVTSGDRIYGGGLIGVYADTEYNNTATSSASIGAITNNLFNDNDVTSDYQIHGGGLVGVFSDSSSSIEAIANNIFSNNIITTSQHIQGGGLVGADAYSQSSTIGDINNNIFIGNTVNTTQGVLGGGLVGVHNESNNLTVPALVGAITNNIFSNNTFEEGDIYGGGLIGAFSHGSYNASAVISIDAVTNNHFNSNNINSDWISGGGLIGISAEGNSLASIGAMTNNFFSNNIINAEGIVRGGGLIGSIIYNNNASIGDINNNIFIGNTVTAGGYITGGVLGIYLDTKASLATWGEFSKNIFTENIINATEDIYSGVLYSTGLDGKLVISDSIFSNNQVSSEIGSVYATAIGINTEYGTNNANGHELTLNATSGGVTYIANHKNNEDDAAIYIGYYESSSSDNAVLNINTEVGGLVALHAPIEVNQDNDFGFTMDIEGAGDFYWGGNNIITVADDGKSEVNFKNGSRTTLFSGYSLTDYSNNGTVNFDSGSTTLVQLTEDPTTLAPSIISNTITVDNNSHFDISNAFSYSSNIFEQNKEQAVLTLTSSGSAAIASSSDTAGSGKISIGIYDYDYTLDWENKGDNDSTAGLIFNYDKDSKTYNKDLAGSSLTMAPGIMANNLPAVQDTNRYTSNLLRSNRTPFVVAGKEGTDWNLWMTPSYTYTKSTGSSDRIGYDVNTYGTTMGLDFNPEQSNAVIGVAVSIYQQNFDATNTDVDGTTYLGQVYGGLTLPHDIEVLGNIGLGKVDYDQKRTAKGERLFADYSSNIFFASSQISKPFVLTESVQFRPFISYDYLHLDVGSYNEHGGSGTLNLHSSSYSQNFHRTRLGSALNWYSDMGINFGAEAFYQNLSGDRQAKTGIYFVNDPTKTKDISVGDALERHSFGLGLSAATSLTNNLSLEGNYQLNVASHTQSHQAKFTLSYAF